jgi:hypothetical protein
MLGLIQVQHLSRHGATRYVHGAIGGRSKLQSCDGDMPLFGAKAGQSADLTSAEPDRRGLARAPRPQAQPYEFTTQFRPCRFSRWRSNGWTT